MNSDNKNTVSLSVAKGWTAAWRTKCPDNCKAFLIPAVDLVQVLNEIGVLGDKAAAKAQAKAKAKAKDVRAYVAIGSEAGGPVEEKLLLVGTNKDDKGIYRDIIDGKSLGANNGPNSGIYDFTSPCPTACDPDSPLN